MIAANVAKAGLSSSHPVAGPRLGIDLGGTKIAAIVTGQESTILSVVETATGNHAEVQPVLDRIIAAVERALAQAAVVSEDLVAIGIGLPGEVEPTGGVFRSSPILPTWRDVPVGPMLQERVGVPVAIENDANAALLGEWAFGAGRDADPILLISIGTGIGGALFAGGRLVHGHRGSAGEIGHLSVDPDGPACWCGERGCLGLLASTTALVNYYQQAAEEDILQPIDGRFVAHRFWKGDPAAVWAVETITGYLARGIAGAACIAAPERVVLFGGILGGLAQPLVEGIRLRLAARPYPAAIASMEVVAAKLGSRAGALGASIISLVSA